MNVKHNLFKTDNSEIAEEIRTYLADHPNAADTLDGIAKWWFLDRAVQFQFDQVKQALDALVAKGLVTEQKGSDSTILYRANRGRFEDTEKVS